ncbi:MAG: RNA polymerase sigma factor [Thalassovita sp.]
MQNVTQDLIDKATAGEAKALEQLVRSSQDNVHRLAVRMMADPVLAEDATQEILIRVITKLSTYRGDSAFSTWVYRIATNYLLTARKVLARDPGLTFDIFEMDLKDGLVDDAQAAAEDHVMINELRLRCTMALLLCLDRPHRAAYVLGDILELSHGEAAQVLEIEPATYRQRLSRARSKVEDHTSRSCGLANADAACSCPRRLPTAIAKQRVGATPDPFFVQAPAYDEVSEMARQTKAELITAKLQRATGPLSAQKDFAQAVLHLVESRVPPQPK